MTKHWIQKAIKRPGQLHRDLHIKPNQPIPLATLLQASKRNDATGRRARLALTLRKLRPKSK